MPLEIRPHTTDRDDGPVWKVHDPDIGPEVLFDLSLREVLSLDGQVAPDSERHPAALTALTLLRSELFKTFTAGLSVDCLPPLGVRNTAKDTPFARACRLLVSSVSCAGTLMREPDDLPPLVEQLIYAAISELKTRDGETQPDARYWRGDVTRRLEVALSVFRDRVVT
jgi:hypothetical protein